MVTAAAAAAAGRWGPDKLLLIVETQRKSKKQTTRRGLQRRKDYEMSNKPITLVSSVLKSVNEQSTRYSKSYV